MVAALYAVETRLSFLLLGLSFCHLRHRMVRTIPSTLVTHV